MIGHNWKKVLFGFVLTTIVLLLIIGGGVSQPWRSGPADVAYTANDLATWHTCGRKTFSAEGRFWLFYSNGSSLYFSSSVDAVSWDTPVFVRADVDDGDKFFVIDKGSYVYLAVATYTGDDLYFRRGTLSSDGTISWEAEQTVVVAEQNDQFVNPCLAIDSDDFLWIGYSKTEFDIVSNSSVTHPWAVRASAEDGSSWETPTQLSTESQRKQASIVSLTQRKMYVILPKAQNDRIRGRLWNGAAWEPEENVSKSEFGTPFRHAYSAVSDGDVIHLLFLESSSLNITYVKYSGGVWSNEKTIQLGASPPVLCLNSTSNALYCLWVYNNTLYVMNSTNNWRGPPEKLVELDSYCESTLTCFQNVKDSIIGLAWVEGTTAPYKIKYGTCEATAQGEEENHGDQTAPEFPGWVFFVLAVAVPTAGIVVVMTIWHKVRRRHSQPSKLKQPSLQE